MKNLRIVLFICSSIFFFSCEDNTKALNQIKLVSQDPVGTAKNIRMVYTDSTKINAVLTAPEHLDFSNLSFKHSVFPKGLKVIFYDDYGNENELISDYGILYNSTKIIDLKGNVMLKSHDGSILKTNQLFWDAEREWLFTEDFFTFQDSTYDFQAYRLDANKEFTKFQTGKLLGEVKFSETKDTIINN
jgi:LPS export ABC transporter protein LptC